MLSEARITEIIEAAKAKRSPKPNGAPGHGVTAPAEMPWPMMSRDAYYGLAGDVVEQIEPHTEADPVAILIQFLTCAGNIIGNCPYYQVEGSRHRTNLFSVLVGQSSKARKGTSWDRISEIVKTADERWFSDRVKGGLSSGEGLINEVRDEFKKWNGKEGAWEIIDPGVSDKRLMVTEPEFAGALVAADRHGNTLSSVIRKAWDGGKLSTMTRSSPLCATGAHISLIGHITIEELRARLTRTDMANGFANRFLFMLVKRSNLLPFGGDELDDRLILEFGERFKGAISSASNIGRVGWTSSARDAWKAVYGQLSEGKPGLLGAVTSRGEAQCVRLALIYALLDGAANIDLPHIRAALAIWEYAEASAAHIFGASLGDNVADDIMRALQNAGREGMSGHSRPVWQAPIRRPNWRRPSASSRQGPGQDGDEANGRAPDRNLDRNGGAPDRYLRPQALTAAEHQPKEGLHLSRALRTPREFGHEKAQLAHFWKHRPSRRGAGQRRWQSLSAAHTSHPRSVCLHSAGPSNLPEGRSGTVKSVLSGN